MEANEAPEKIYVDSKAIGDNISTTVHTKRQDYSTCTEYSRTDAFIEKAERYIRSVADGLDRDDDVEAFISGFRKYMKGEDV